LDKKNKKVILEPEKNKKYFYYYPQLVVVIGVRDGDKVNFMPCVWNTGLSYDPFLYGVSVGADRFTCKMLNNVNEYSINFLGFEYIKMIRSLGRSSGSYTDKSNEFNVRYSESVLINAPIIDVAYYSLECRKKSSELYGDHVLFVGKVELMHLNEALAEDYIINTKIVSPTLYLGVDHYIAADDNSLISLKNMPFHYKTGEKKKSKK